jgi:hypothetical protein
MWKTQKKIRSGEVENERVQGALHSVKHTSNFHARMKGRSLSVSSPFL